jgi:hypothetical protein
MRLSAILSHATHQHPPFVLPSPLPSADLDDALSLVHLFASLPAAQQVKPVRTAAATRLVREWQYYIARSHALRKVFFSVKGVYFQAEVRGVAITWLQPWSLSQHLPRDVDFRTMLTFLDLYDTLLQVRAGYTCVLRVTLGGCCACSLLRILAAASTGRLGV